MKRNLIFLILVILITFQPFLPKELHYSIIFSLVEIGLIAYLWLIYNKKWNSNNSTEVNGSLVCNNKIIQLVRQIRHDWLNHLQVIQGYASLNKADQISKYISKANQEARQYSIITSFASANLAVFLYMITINYPKLSFDLEIAEDIKVIENDNHGDWILSTFKSFLDTFYKAVKENIEQHLIISFAGIDNKIIINFEFEGNVQPIYQEIQKIGEEFNNNKGFFLTDIHNEQEFIMELHFPLEQN